MVSIQVAVLKTRAAAPGLLASGVLATLVVLAGCSSWHKNPEEASNPTAVSSAAQSDSGSTSADELTATEAAIAGSAAPAGESTQAAPITRSAISPTAPKSYVVKRGDTLWGIASMFLKDPWLWPEVWYINPQVNNPHLIYPGDTLALAFGADGRPQVRLEQGGAVRLNPRLRSSPLDGAIPTIAYSTIAAFLSRPTVLTADQISKAPYVLAFREEHVVGGAGHEIYVRDLKGGQNDRYTVVHVGDELRDPDDGKVLGYQGIYTATALVSTPGNPAKALLTDTERETIAGDKLLATDTEVPLTFILRSPSSDVHGRIISVIDGVELIGQYQIVVINRGKRQGVDAGNVLAVDHAGELVPDRDSTTGWKRAFGTSFAPKVKLPDERSGTLLVFKSYDRLSYALVVGASAPLRVNDVIHNP